MFRRGEKNTLDYGYHPSKQEIKRATRPRLGWSLLTSLLLLVSLIFVILVEVGSTSLSSVPKNVYFIKLELSSVASLLGLYDLYTVGLWGFCEGSTANGLSGCSNPKTMYWFNPEAILQNQLPAGTPLVLPSGVTDLLPVIRVASHWMFALFLTGACLTFLMIFIVPFSTSSRRATIPIMLVTFLAAAFTTAAAAIATAIFTVVKDKVRTITTVPITAQLGRQMFIYMWIAAAAAVLAWIIQVGMCCCCTSRRDVRTGRKRPGSAERLMEERKSGEGA